MSDDKQTDQRSGFVGILGRPNVGKSTLLNALVGEKIAGVSSKPQTTRDIVRGILTEPQGQAVYLDLPGFHDPKDKIGNWMMRRWEETISEIDLAYLMVLPRPIERYERRMLEALEDEACPTILLINQIDRFKKSQVLPVIQEYQSAYPFKEFIPISASKGIQLDVLKERTFHYLPQGPHLFPDDQISDQNTRFLVCELIREKLYHHTHEEVPYATTVVIEHFEERDDKITEIHASIIVNRDSQKGIIVGKQGANIKKMGMEARKDLESLIGSKVFLKLVVKLEENWKDDKRMLQKFGYA